MTCSCHHFGTSLCLHRQACFSAVSSFHQFSDVHRVSVVQLVPVSFHRTKERWRLHKKITSNKTAPSWTTCQSCTRVALIISNRRSKLSSSPRWFMFGVFPDAHSIQAVEFFHFAWFEFSFNYRKANVAMNLSLRWHEVVVLFSFVNIGVTKI